MRRRLSGGQRRVASSQSGSPHAVVGAGAWRGSRHQEFPPALRAARRVGALVRIEGGMTDQQVADRFAERLGAVQEREDILRSLDVLAGLMGCFAAMEERARKYTDDSKTRRFERTQAIAEHWRAA